MKRIIFIILALAIVAPFNTIIAKDKKKANREEWYAQMRQHKHDFIDDELDLTDEQEDKFRHRKRQIQQIQHNRRLAHLRQQLGNACARAFRTHHVHIAPAAERQKRHNQDKHTHAPYPVRKATPKQQGFRHPFDLIAR